MRLTSAFTHGDWYVVPTSRCCRTTHAIPKIRPMKMVLLRNLCDFPFLSHPFLVDGYHVCNQFTRRRNGKCGSAVAVRTSLQVVWLVSWTHPDRGGTDFSAFHRRHQIVDQHDVFPLNCSAKNRLTTQSGTVVCSESGSTPGPNS